MKEYTDLVRKVLGEGEERETRSGPVFSIFGHQMRFDLRDGFPLLGIKKTLFSSVVKELLWFLRGENNIKALGCKIWDEWAAPDGSLGPIYGVQWRRLGEEIMLVPIDQIEVLLNGLRTDPYSRRHIVSAWNPIDLPRMALAPCHTLFQLYVSTQEYQGKRFLDLHLYQRSADIGLGLPFNIASYALLLELIAKEVGFKPRYLVHTLGDAHIYKNHAVALAEMLGRSVPPLPRLWLSEGRKIPSPNIEKSLWYTDKDISVTGYYPNNFIKLEVAVLNIF
jgi:thymidylate synthase